jgi:hypothetical protein
MSSKVAKLVSAYRQHLTVPWQAGLAAIQRVIFAVYDKADELRLRANVEEFALATQQAGKQWLLLDVTNAFPSGWPRRSTATPTSNRPKTWPATRRAN